MEKVVQKTLELKKAQSNSSLTNIMSGVKWFFSCFCHIRFTGSSKHLRKLKSELHTLKCRKKHGSNEVE